MDLTKISALVNIAFGLVGISVFVALLIDMGRHRRRMKKADAEMEASRKRMEEALLATRGAVFHGVEIRGQCPQCGAKLVGSPSLPEPPSA